MRGEQVLCLVPYTECACLNSCFFFFLVLSRHFLQFCSPVLTLEVEGSQLPFSPFTPKLLSLCHSGHTCSSSWLAHLIWGCLWAMESSLPALELGTWAWLEAKE